jgi:hypothetical protein
MGATGGRAPGAIGAVEGDAAEGGVGRAAWRRTGRTAPEPPAPRSSEGGGACDAEATFDVRAGPAGIGGRSLDASDDLAPGVSAPCVGWVGP